MIELDQQIFRFRALTSPTRPLADPTDYELLRSYLASGDLVATTFYGEVRFDAYGQNTGRKPTTLQVASDGVARVVFPVSIEAVERKVFDFPSPAALAECDATSAIVDYADECLLCDPLLCTSARAILEMRAGLLAAAEGNQDYPNCPCLPSPK